MRQHHSRPRLARFHLAWVALLAAGAAAACRTEAPDAHRETLLPSTVGDLLGTAMAAPAGSASVSGKVTLAGKAPERKILNMKSDPFCAKRSDVKDEEVVVGAAGQLKNVVVRVAKGATGTFPVPATPAILDQVACMYTPRVVVAQAGQDVHIKNSDQTLHNVHTYKGPATLFNVAQVQGFPPIKRKFPQPGDVIKFKCDVHPWMTGYLLVTDNPFFAVTGDDGSFALASLPDGKYTIEAWHERFGTMTQEVTVAGGKAAEVNFEFKVK